MMKKTWKQISAFVISLCLFSGMVDTAFAADSLITYNGNGNWEISPGSGYTDTDLFDGLKDVMPGDVRTEKININNKARNCDYIKVYLQALPHDEQGNPLTYNEDFEEADGKASGSDADRDETVPTMADFLAQLSMKVYNGEQLIYEESPDKTDGLTESVYLAKLRTGQSISLDVNLEVPITLGNEYAYRVGEVDWKILIEEHKDSSGGGGGSSGGGGGSSGGGGGSPGGPGTSETTTILPFEIPLGPLPQTGTQWWLVPVLAVAGVSMILIGFIRKRRKGKTE